MSDRVWVRHPDLGVTKEVAASAVRVLVRGGWKQLDDTETAALLEEQQAEKAQRVADLTPAPKTPAPAPAKAPTPAAKPDKKAAAAGRQDTEKESDV